MTLMAEHSWYYKNSIYLKKENSTQPSYFLNNAELCKWILCEMGKQIPLLEMAIVGQDIK